MCNHRIHKIGQWSVLQGFTDQSFALVCRNEGLVTGYTRQAKRSKTSHLYLPDHGQFVNRETRTKEVHNALDLVTVLGLVDVACTHKKTTTHSHHHHQQ